MRWGAVFVGLLIIVVLFGMSFYYTTAGQVLLNAEDLQSAGVTCKNAATGTVAVSSISGKGTSVEFTLAAYGAKISMDFDYDIGDLKDYPISLLSLEVTGLEVNGTDKIKVYLSDAAADTDYYLGYFEKVTGTYTFQLDYEKIEDKSLSETADVFIVLVAYDKLGAIANGFKNDDQEVGVSISTGQTATGSGPVGVIGATLLSMVIMIRRVIAGIMGALGSFCAVLFTNNTIVIIIVAVAFAAIVLLLKEKSIRGTL